MTGALSPMHWAIIVGVLLLLFGGKRLPDAARGLGRSLRIFKAETATLGKGDGEPEADGKPEGDGKPAAGSAVEATSTPSADAPAVSRTSERAA